MFNPELFKVSPKLTTQSEKSPTAAPKGDFQKLVANADESGDEEDKVAEKPHEKASLFSLSATKPVAKGLNAGKEGAGERSTDMKIPTEIQDYSLKAMKGILPALSPTANAAPMLPGGKLQLDQSALLEQSALNVPTLSDLPLAQTDPKMVKPDLSMLKPDLAKDPTLVQAPMLTPKLNKLHSKVGRSLERDSMDTDSTVPLSKLTNKPKVNVRASLSEDRPDLAYLAPRIPAAPIVAIDKPVEAKAPPATMQEIAAEVVKSIDILNSEGKTETIVTLNNGVFKDAVLTITAFDNLKGQFNINFGNLNDVALKIIARTDNQNALEAALISKGFTPTITISNEGSGLLGRGDKEEQPNQESYPEEG